MAGRKPTYEGYLNRLKGRKIYGFDKPLSRPIWEETRDMYYEDNGTTKGFNDYIYDKTVYKYSKRQAEALMRAQEEGRLATKHTYGYYLRHGSEEISDFYNELQDQGMSKREAAYYISYYIFGSP